MQKMSELQVLYSEEELKQIDLEIETQMSVYLDQQIQSSVLTKLVSLFGELDYSKFGDLVEKAQKLPEELVVCELMYYLDQQHKEERSELVGHIADREHAIAELKAKEVGLSEKLGLANTAIEQREREILQLHKKLLSLNQHSYMQQEAILHKQQHINELKGSINQKQLSLKQKQVEKQQIIDDFRDQSKEYESKLSSAQAEIEQLYEVMNNLHEELADQIESKRINLTTHAIQADQISLNYAEALCFYTKSERIQAQNKQIVTLFAQLENSLITYELKPLNLSLKELQEPFNEQLREIALQQARIAQMRQLLQCKVDNHLKNRKQLLSKLAQCESSLAQSKRNELQNEKQLKMSRQKIEILEKTMHHLTESNYKILLDLQQTKSKAEQSYLRECQLTKTLNLELDLMKKLNLSTKSKLECIEVDLSNQRQINEQMKKKLANFQIRYNELEQIHLNLKNSINHQLSLYDKDQNSQLQLVQHLIEKNQQLMKELALAKSKLTSLDYQKQINCEIKETLQKELIQKMETVDFTLNTNKILNQENQRLQSTLKQKQTQLMSLSRMIDEKQKTICILKDNSQQLSKTILIQQVDQEVQTDIKVRESQIRRQKLASQLSSQLSHSCFEISDDQELKENVLSSLNITNNLQKFKFRSPVQSNEPKLIPCNHLQKIAALNQIINYFMNYIKGYMGTSLRANSWLSHKIAKHGPEYQAKLFDEGSIRTKMKNIKRIEQICSKETVCAKLINEFESIMEFYFEQKSNILREKSLNGTISKSRVNGTSNKCNFNDKTAIIYSRVYK